MSPYKKHCERWADGCGSGLCAGATHVVIARGTIPCDVLFIGEAPGVSEDILGKPFKGPAGHLLDLIISRASAGLPKQPRCAFTNIVGCMPKDEAGDKITEPLDEDIIQCQDRLLQFIQLADPKAIVLVGKLSQHWVGSGYKGSLRLPNTVPTVDITHPAAILRSPVQAKGLVMQRCVVAVRELMEGLS